MLARQTTPNSKSRPRGLATEPNHWPVRTIKGKEKLYNWNAYELLWQARFVLYTKTEFVFRNKLSKLFIILINLKENN
jgi:hypothetical protein